MALPPVTCIHGYILYIYRYCYYLKVKNVFDCYGFCWLAVAVAIAIAEVVVVVISAFAGRFYRATAWKIMWNV